MAEQRLTWRRAVPGLFILGALIVTAGATLWFARVGALRGDTYRLYALSNEARGVIKGTEVWLDGKKVGLVRDVRFRAPSADTLERMLLVLDILTEHEERIREDSRVSIRSGGRLISSPVIFISSGTLEKPVFARRDTLHPARQSDMETLTSELTLAARDIKPIVANVRQLRAMVSRSRARVEEGRTDRGEVALSTVGRDVRRFTQRASNGGGTFGAVIRDDSLLTARGRRAIARADSILALARRPEGSLTRFTSDSAAARQLTSLRNELSIVRARMQAASGSLGRFARDSAITWQMMRREELLKELMADIKRDPGRYIAF